MKTTILILSLCLIYMLSYSQGVTPVKKVRVANATTAFNENLPISSEVTNIATGEIWSATAAVISTATLTTASASFSLVNGSGVTNLSEGTSTTTTVDVNSNTGSNATLLGASTSRAGVMTKAKFDEVVANTAKVSNVSTNLSIGTVTTTTVDVNSSDGTNATVPAATVSTAGVLPTSKWSEIVANTAKATNVPTSLSVGTVNTTTVAITSDGSADDVVLPAATVSTAGVLPTSKWSEIVANNAKVTNATHTGDVTGATALTIGADKVLDSHINWGTAASQISAVDVPIADAGAIITATEVEGALQENRTAINLNTAKATNVPTSLSVGTVNTTTVAITSDGSADDVVIPAATVSTAGVLPTSKWSEIVANNAKVTNVSTTLAIGTKAATTMGITSDGGADDVILPAATTTEAGLMTEAQFDKLAAIAPGANVNLTMVTEKFEEDDGIPTAHTLGHTTVVAYGCRVSLNGMTLNPASYTLTTTTITIGLPVSQYDEVVITYNY